MRYLITGLQKNEQILEECEKISTYSRQLIGFIVQIRCWNNVLSYIYNPFEKTWQLAPIFDNGLSLLSDEKDYTPGKPLTILKRQVKAKPFNSSFSKQLALYTGPAFIHKQALIEAVETSNLDFGRAKQVLFSQLNDPSFKHLFIEGSETHD